MTIRVGPTEKQPTHHVKLTDRNGNSVGLILCNDKGEPAPMYNRTPIERTALKTTSGGGSYADFNYPYSPIVQDDWSGGRGNLNFESDSTRYFDGHRVTTRHSNKVFLGPQEWFSNGYRSLNYPINKGYHRAYQETIVAPFTASSTYTSGRVWLRAQKNGTPNNITLSIKRTSDNVTMGSGTLDVAGLDVIGEWISVNVSASLTSGIAYYLSISEVQSSLKFLGYYSFSQNAGTFFLIEPAAVDDTCIYYEYKGQQYKVLSTAGAAPTVWMNGDRGAADSNAGQLTKLIDATKTWTVNAWAGCIVKIVQGTGRAETTLYRTISSNTDTELICSEAWEIEHNATTEYVILGSNTWRELTGHGLTVPVTSVLNAKGIMYFAQGDDVFIRSHREYNNAGVWTESDWNEETNIKGIHLAYQPLADRIWIAQITSLFYTTPQTYGTDLNTFTLVTVGYTYEFINGLEVYPNDSGTEALWVYKEELAYVVTTIATGIKLDEMRYLRSRENGKANLVHNVYSYFTLGNGLQRYYGGSIDSIGPNLDEGLPTNRQGKIVQLLGYPGRVMAIIDGGTSGYSSLLERDGSGWHEVYRAPLGEKLKAMALQVIPGVTVDRLWLYQGNISLWLPIASNGVEETKDSGYTYAPEGALILSVMHAGLFDVQKIVKKITLWAKNLIYNYSANGEQRTIDIDYRLEETDEWVNMPINVLSGPTSSEWSDISLGAGFLPPVTDVIPDNISTISVFGVAAKYIQFRLRLFSNSSTYTPILTAAVIEAVSMIQIKYMYNLTFRVVDDEPTLTPREMDEDSVTAAGMSAITKLAQIESWADADTAGLLYMESNSPLYDGKYVFINPPVTRQIATDPDSTRQWTGFGFVCSTTAQEA